MPRLRRGFVGRCAKHKFVEVGLIVGQQPKVLELTKIERTPVDVVELYLPAAFLRVVLNPRPPLRQVVSSLRYEILRAIETDLHLLPGDASSALQQTSDGDREFIDLAGGEVRPIDRRRVGAHTPHRSTAVPNLGLRSCPKFGTAVLTSSTMRVWLDDTREAPVGWVRTRTVDETVDLLHRGEVLELSLDFDLDETDPGHKGSEVLDYLEAGLRRGALSIPVVHIHSANPYGAAVMTWKLQMLERMFGQQPIRRPLPRRSMRP